jgi:dTDP-4-dehydrorhamnose 3,5-epimerase
MEFHTGPIEGLIWRPLKKYNDKRGWLCELFRHDEVPPEYHPVMSYISMTEPGVARGPHEHVDQSDLFCFLGPGNFKVYVWDNRPKSPTYRARMTEVVGIDRPMFLIIPPGVAHAYRNVSNEQGIVFNCPNRLYKGPSRKDPVDEIRHEEDPNSPFRLD